MMHYIFKTLIRLMPHNYIYFFLILLKNLFLGFCSGFVHSEYFAHFFVSSPPLFLSVVYWLHHETDFSHLCRKELQVCVRLLSGTVKDLRERGRVSLPAWL